MKTAVFHAEVNPYELTVRMVEAVCGIKRPEGVTSKQAYEALEPKVQEDFMIAGRVAFEYMQECLGNMHRQQ